MSPIYTPGKLILRRTYIGLDDPDAAAYITAVEIADGQPLEIEVRVAIHTFVKGCKADGIWPAIKASCIMAGARTLAGALVPLVGPAPTNFNFVAGDYNRKTGLVGNGSTKYLNSNRSSANEMLNNAHLSSFASTHGSAQGGYIGLFNAPTTTVSLVGLGSSQSSRFYLQSTAQIILAVPQNSTLLGISRSTAGQSNTIVNNQTATQANTSTNTTPLNYFIFAYNNNGSPGFYTNARLAFYSIGESLNLTLLDARVTTLINAFGAAIT
jgi:hypothetical protein